MDGTAFDAEHVRFYVCERGHRTTLDMARDRHVTETWEARPVDAGRSAAGGVVADGIGHVVLVGLGMRSRLPLYFAAKLESGKIGL